MSLKPYPEYKHSGVAWLGDLPRHWEIVRYKQVFREREDRSESGSETLLSVSAYTGVSPRSDIIDDGEHLTRAESLEGYKVCYPDDLVMNIMLAWNKGLGFSTYKGIVSPAYCVFYIIDGSDPKFLNYMVRDDRINLYFKAFSSGVIDSRLRIYPDTFGSLYCLLPPKPEQRMIAAFLDRETDKIDNLIAEQEKLIVLLAEKRQATISKAVTKGLNPAVPMNDSGVECLGKIPSGWTVKPIKYAICLATSGPRGWSEMLGEEGAIFFQSQNIGRSMDLYLSDAKRITPPKDAEADRAKIRDDDVVICITGGRTGAVAHIKNLPENAYVNQHVCILRPAKGKVLGRYLAYALSSHVGQEQLEIAMSGLKQGLGLDAIRNVYFVVPAFAEQQQIVEFLDSELGKIEGLTTDATSVIDLLQERRKALISAAVTGKIDVRRPPAEIIELDAARRRLRGLLAVELIEKSQGRATFGRTALQKHAYLAEAFAGMHELAGKYVRNDYGPLDRDMIDDMESEAQALCGIVTQSPTGMNRSVTYLLSKPTGTLSSELLQHLGPERSAKLQRLQTLLAPLNTHEVEGVATLFAVWNDFLIQQEVPTEDDIVNGFLNDWHPAKSENFNTRELRLRLKWMRDHELVPTGGGPKTETGRLFV